MKKYEKYSLIQCNIDDLFAFHLDLNNLKKITPQNIKVTLLGEKFTPKEGDVLRLRTLKNFIPMVWEVEIAQVRSPTLLVDVALKSPFKFWKHSHIFTYMGDGFCELKDRVEYKLPFGFIGNFFNFLVKYELESMFSYRHRVTKEALER